MTKKSKSKKPKSKSEDGNQPESDMINYGGEKKGGALTLDEFKGRSTQFYITALVIVAIVVYILYYSYTCFCTNQALSLSEPFTEKTIKSGIDSDKAFDVDDEINKLRELQEKYLQILTKK